MYDFDVLNKLAFLIFFIFVVFRWQARDRRSSYAKALSCFCIMLGQPWHRSLQCIIAFSAFAMSMSVYVSLLLNSAHESSVMSRVTLKVHLNLYRNVFTTFFLSQEVIKYLKLQNAKHSKKIVIIIGIVDTKPIIKKYRKR